MPIYEYICPKCQHHFEVIQKISDDEAAACPECSTKASRMISAPHFKLKGTGWYETDFKTPKQASKDDPKDAKPKASKDKAEK